LKPRYLALDNHPKESYLTKKHSEVIAAIELKMEQEHQTKETTEIEREIQHVSLNFAVDIDNHLRKLE